MLASHGFLSRSGSAHDYHTNNFSVKVTCVVCTCNATHNISMLQLKFDEAFDEASSSHTPEVLPEWACA
jgi:hypothetical protein